MIFKNLICANIYNNQLQLKDDNDDDNDIVYFQKITTNVGCILSNTHICFIFLFIYLIMILLYFHIKQLFFKIMTIIFFIIHIVALLLFYIFNFKTFLMYLKFYNKYNMLFPTELYFEHKIPSDEINIIKELLLLQIGNVNFLKTPLISAIINNNFEDELYILDDFSSLHSIIQLDNKYSGFINFIANIYSIIDLVLNFLIIICIYKILNMANGQQYLLYTIALIIGILLMQSIFMKISHKYLTKNKLYLYIYYILQKRYITKEKRIYTIPGIHI